MKKVELNTAVEHFSNINNYRRHWERLTAWSWRWFACQTLCIKLQWMQLSKGYLCGSFINYIILTSDFIILSQKRLEQMPLFHLLHQQVRDQFRKGSSGCVTNNDIIRMVPHHSWPFEWNMKRKNKTHETHLNPRLVPSGFLFEMSTSLTVRNNEHPQGE